MCVLHLRSSPSQDRPGAEGTFGNTVKREERRKWDLLKKNRNFKLFAEIFLKLFKFLINVYIFISVYSYTLRAHTSTAYYCCYIFLLKKMHTVEY